jgi:hypothetical protein
MRLLTIICFLAVNLLAADDPKWEWKRHPTVEEEFNDSKCVFVGKVVNARRVLDLDGFIQGTSYTVRVEELLKGSLTKQVEIYDENSSGRFPMRVGVKYLLFAHENHFEGVEGLHLAIDNCGNSGTLRQTRKVLATVRKLKETTTLPSGATTGSQSFRLETNRTPSAAGSRRWPSHYDRQIRLHQTGRHGDAGPAGGPRGF